MRTFLLPELPLSSALRMEDGGKDHCIGGRRIKRMTEYLPVVDAVVDAAMRTMMVKVTTMMVKSPFAALSAPTATRRPAIAIQAPATHCSLFHLSFRWILAAYGEGVAIAFTSNKIMLKTCSGTN